MQIRNRLSGWLALAVFATVGGAMVAADPAFAKVDVDKLTIGGEVRARYEYRIGTTFGVSQANESAASERVRVNVGYDLTPDVSFFAQLQDARIWGSEGNDRIGGGTSGLAAVSSQNNNGTGVDLHQGYIQLKNVLVPGLSLKMGRQEIIFGDHRLFGNFGWSQIGNAFDGVRATYSTGMADVDLFWVRVFESEVSAGCGTAATATANCTGVIFNGAGTKGTLDQDVYGAYLTLKPVPNWTIEPYYFLLKDSRAATASTAAAITQAQTLDQARSTLGGRINGKAGGLDATAEGAWQFGGVAGLGGAAGAPQQHNLHINAEAAAAKIGYTFEPVPMRPRLGFEVDYASGDNCVAATTSATTGCNAVNHANTFDNLFPTNHFHYGYMDLMAWRNMVNYQVMFDVKPSPVSKLQFNYIIHRLARTTDNWYRAAQAIYVSPTATNQEASLGQELDVHYWHTFKEKFKFEIGYGHFFAGAFLDKAASVNTTGSPTSTTNAVGNGGQDWGYVMGSILF